MDTHVSDNELSRIGFFKSQSRVEFSSKLHAYKRNIILVGSFLLFMVLGGVQLDKFSVGLISGSVSNTYVVKIFAAAFLIYNYIMFRMYVNKEVSGEDARRNILSKFTKSIAEFVFQRELNKNLRNKGLSFLNANKKDIRVNQESDTPKEIECYFTVTGDKFVEEYLGDIVADKDIEVKNAGSYKSVEDGSVGKDFLWRYTLPDELLAYFNKNIAYKKSLHLQEIFEIRVPEWYFWAVLIIQVAFYFISCS